MDFILYVSQMIIPFVIFYVIGYGLLMKVPVYDSFIKGANNGLKTVVKLVPTLIGLMIATGVLRASGFLDFLAGAIGQFSALISFPGDLVPLTILRMCCTETIFYTMSVYFMTAGIKKTRHTLPGALLATFAGIAASVILAGWMH